MTDNSLTHGRGGVATFMARADFDDVHVAGTDIVPLFEREWGLGGSDYEIDLDELSGDWQVLDDQRRGRVRRSRAVRSAIPAATPVAVIGTPVREPGHQRAHARRCRTGLTAGSVDRIDRADMSTRTTTIT